MRAVRMTGVCGEMRRVFWLSVVIVRERHLMQLCRSGGRRRSSSVCIVWLFVLRVSVLEGWRREGSALVVERVVLARIGGVGSVMRRIGSLGRRAVRIHGTMWRTWKWSTGHGLGASKVGPGRYLTTRIRAHAVGGLSVMRVSIVRIRDVAVRTWHCAKERSANGLRGRRDGTQG